MWSSTLFKGIVQRSAAARIPDDLRKVYNFIKPWPKKIKVNCSREHCEIFCDHYPFEGRDAAKILKMALR